MQVTPPSTQQALQTNKVRLERAYHLLSTGSILALTLSVMKIVGVVASHFALTAPFAASLAAVLPISLFTLTSVGVVLGLSAFLAHDVKNFLIHKYIAKSLINAHQEISEIQKEIESAEKLDPLSHNRLISLDNLLMRTSHFFWNFEDFRMFNDVETASGEAISEAIGEAIGKIERLLFNTYQQTRS